MRAETLRAVLRTLALAVLLGGCAAPRMVMKADPGQPEGRAAAVWPDAPETARYRYVGQLLGEDNFVPENGDTGGAAIRVLHWLVGLAGGKEQKVTLKRPQSGAVDAQGRVYVTDVSNHAVFVFDQAGATLLVWNMAQKRRAFVTPVGIAIGAGGQVLVADAELGQVFRLDRDGNPLGSFGAGILNRPTGLARDAQRGRIYVADTHAHDIKVFDDAGTLLEVIGRRGEGEGELNYPTHLVFGGERLYVSDSINARVVMFDALGKPAGTLGQRGLYIGNLTRPKGVTLDHEGNLYVVESMYDRLLVFNREGQFLMPIGGTGKETGQFFLPAGAWSGPQGRIYVADMFNGRVVMFQFLGGA